VPEGPEVETIRRSLEPHLLGAVLGKAHVSKLALRTQVTARDFAFLQGKRITSTGRHGKLMWIDVDGGGGMLVRLGMTGRVLVNDKSETKLPHTHVRLALNDDRELRYVDPRRFGSVVPFEDRAVLDVERAHIGPDCLSIDDAGRATIRTRLSSTTRALKDVLLDQTLFAGVGNIYAAEALFEARLSPFARACDLSDDDATRLIARVEQVLALAVERRGTSFSDYVDAKGYRGLNQIHLAVFQREGEPCPVCGAPVVRVVQGARSTFLCPTCQGVPSLSDTGGRDI
jgi:formamidopyrimidine-DNA glycosylase